MKAPSAEQSYTLCTLVNKEDAQIQFSPFVWKTIIELRYLNVRYTQEHHTFDGIRTDLAKELGDEKVLVPVLKDAEGKWLKNSFEIAQYLDRTHALPKGKSLFLHGVGGREFCRFVNYWADTVLAPNVGAVVRPRVSLIASPVPADAQTWSTLPPNSPSSAYFAKTRFQSVEGAHSALSTSLDASRAAEHFAAARKCLKLVNSMLSFQYTQGKKFIGGDFSHADAAVFGWYVWSIQFAPEFRTEVWETEENREVGEWVREMRGLQGWEEGDFMQIPAVL